VTGDLDQRTGWPAELRALLAQYPRDTWTTAASPMAQFWLERHAEFRYHATALEEMAKEYRNDRKSIEEFTTWTAPRLQGFLGALHGHHQIEDFHYFPVFRATRRELASGFDVLASDHELLHQGIIEIVESFNTLLTLAHDGNDADKDTRRHARDHFLARSERMFTRLDRHLDDEEDLIIPIMLERDGA
jgi:Hemerythrin HHE cation binding domain